MKRVLTCVGGMLLSFAFVSVVYASGIDNKTSWSAEYTRTFNRNAATDYADIAAYNPAGTVKLQDGLTISGSVQYVGKEFKNIIAGTSYETDEPSIIPGIFGVYNRNKWSLFGAVTIVAGGGKVDFSQGSYKTVLAGLIYIPGDLESSQLKAESHYLGYTLGGAYEVNDMFSFSVGLRYVDAYKEMQGSITTINTPGPFPDPLTETVAFEQDGDGWGGIFGINLAPNDKLNIGMRYETRTDINLYTTIITDTATYLPGGGLAPNFGYADGTSSPRDLPATFGIGVSYWLTPQLRVEANFTNYFNEDADWGGKENNVDNGYDVGIALEYHFNDTLLASIGYMKTETGIDPQYMSNESPELDANTICGGIGYAFTERFHTNLGMAFVFYDDDSFIKTIPSPPAPVQLDIPVGYEKDIFIVTLGAEYRF